MTKGHETYRGWVIVYEPPPINDRRFDYTYYHPEYDSSPDANDERFGHAATFQQAREAIDLWEAYLNET